MKCPVCNAELPSTAKFCGGCGTTLTTPPPPQSFPAEAPYQQPRPQVSAPPAYAGGGYGGQIPTVAKKYKVLRLIAVLIKILAFIAGAIMMIGGLVMVIAGAASSSKTATAFPDSGPAVFFGGLVTGLILIVYGVFVFIFLYAYSEWMYVFMDIEENTRITNQMLGVKR